MKLKTAAVGVAAAGLAFIAGPAMATGNSYDVSVGGSTAAGTHTVTADTITDVKFSVKNAAGTVIEMGCTGGSVSSSAGSVVNSGSGITDIAEINGLQLTGCVAAGGVPVNVTIDNGLILHGTSAATAAKTDTIQGHIHGIHAEVRSVIPNLCNFDANGQVDGSYDEATDQLSVAEVGHDGDLTVDNVTGCTGAFANGDAASFEATFEVKDASGNPIDVNVLP